MRAVLSLLFSVVSLTVVRGWRFGTNYVPQVRSFFVLSLLSLHTFSSQKSLTLTLTSLQYLTLTHKQQHYGQWKFSNGTEFRNDKRIEARFADT